MAGVKAMTVLFAPPDYWALTEDQRNEICNGCGPKGLDYLVPDTIWFLSIKEACRIHDFMYEMGETLADKEAADRIFRNNMVRIIEANPTWRWLTLKRLERAEFYYNMVDKYGGPSFWKGKNKPEELGLAFA